jgi:hypothetical protein
MVVCAFHDIHCVYIAQNCYSVRGRIAAWSFQAFMIACRVCPSSVRFLPAPNPSAFASRYCTNHSPRYVPSLQPSMLEMSSTIVHRHIYLHTTLARCSNKYLADDTRRGGTILAHKFMYSLAEMQFHSKDMQVLQAMCQSSSMPAIEILFKLPIQVSSKCASIANPRDVSSIACHRESVQRLERNSSMSWELRRER